MAIKTVSVTFEDSTRRKYVRKTAIRYGVHCFGFALSFGSYGAVIFLQSSMNITGSLGALSLALAYTASVVFSMFFVPSLVRKSLIPHTSRRIFFNFIETGSGISRTVIKFGCRRCWLFADLTYLLYILSNFYPATYTIIPAGILVGVGESLLWTCAPMVYIYFGNVHGSHGSRPIKSYLRQYTGAFYVTMLLSMIGGNLISWLVLFYSRELGAEDVGKTETLRNNNTNNDLITADRFLDCGANDCADPNITNANLSQYVPNIYSTYALIIVFASLCIIAIVVHYHTVPDLTTCGTDMNTRDNVNTDGMLPVYDPEEIVPSMRETIKANFKHCVEIQQLLVSPILLYYGLCNAYIASEVMRAFVSCLLGVEQVGISVIAISLGAVLSSASYGKITGRFGRNALVPFLVLSDLANYSFGLLWKPQSDTLGILYISLVFFGISDGFWKNFLTDFTTDYFRNNQEIVFNVWNIWITMGIALQFALGSVFIVCVRTKIYMLIVIYIVSVMFYAVAEKRYRRRNIENLE